MRFQDVGKTMELKVVMAVRAPNRKLLLLFDNLNKPTNEPNNVRQLKLFMEKYK